MGYGRRGDEWARWAKWFSLYSAAHGVSQSPNSFLPPEFKVKEATPEPFAKLSMRQWAQARGQHIGGEKNGSK